MSEPQSPLSAAELEADTWASWWEAHAAQRDMYAAGITGMDVPTEAWTKEDIAYWAGSARHEPWKDVAALFVPRAAREERDRAAVICAGAYE